MKKSKLKMNRITIQQLSDSDLPSVNGGSIACPYTVPCTVHCASAGPAVCLTQVCEVKG